MQRTEGPRLDAAFRLKVAKSIMQVSNSNDNFALVAVRTADRLVRERGATWLDLICGNAAEQPTMGQRHQPDELALFWCWPARWQRAVTFCERCHEDLRPRDAAFIQQLRSYTETPSEKQCAWLRNICERLLSQGFVP